MIEKVYILFGVVMHEGRMPLVSSSDEGKIKNALTEINNYVGRCLAVGKRFRRDDFRYIEAMTEAQKNAPYGYEDLDMYDYFEIAAVKNI